MPLILLMIYSVVYGSVTSPFSGDYENNEFLDSSEITKKESNTLLSYLPIDRLHSVQNSPILDKEGV